MEPQLIDGRYQVIASVGSGLSGEVFQVRGPEGLAALKLLRAEVPGLNEEERIATFKFEFSLLTGLSHPNIIRIFDFGYAEELKRFYFTQEWVEGKNLFEIAKHLDLAALQDLLIQSLQGLAYLHNQNVVHGDLKPENLLVTMKPDGSRLLKIIDFGISHPSLVETAGTPAYLAPEKILKEGSGTSSDLYSLGVVFFSILTGENPFVRSRVEDTLRAQLNFFPPSATTKRPELEPVWSELIEQLLQKNPRHRIDSAESCLKFLETKGEVRIAAGKPKALQAYWIGRQEILETGKEFLRRISTDSKSRLLLVSGEAGLGKGSLLTELKYEAELKGIEVLQPEEKPRKQPAVMFIQVDAAQHLPAAARFGEWLKKSSVVLACPPESTSGLVHTLKKFSPQVLLLRPLKRMEVEEVLRDITRNKEIPPPFINALFRLTQGYPAQLFEALQHLLKDPLIVDASGKWHLAVFREVEPTLEQLGFSESSLAHLLHGHGVEDAKERWSLELKRAEALAKQGSLDEALKLLNSLEAQISSLFEHEDRLPRRSQLLEKRGWIYSKQRRFQEAREAFASALSLLQEMNSPPQVLELRIRNFIAFLNLQEGRVEDSIREFEENSRKTGKLSAKEQRAVTNNELGQAYLVAGRTNQAIQQIKTDLAFFETLPDLSFKMKANYNLGEAYAKESLPDEAYNAYSRVADIARQERDWEYLIRAYNGMGNICYSKKDYVSCLDFYQRSLGLSEYLRDYLCAATVAQNRGALLAELKRLDEALHDLDLSKRLLSKVTPSSHSRYLMARATLELGEAHRKKKNFRAAQNFFTEALNRSEEDPNLKGFLFYPLASLAALALDQNDVGAFRVLYPKLIHLATGEEEKKLLADLIAKAPSDPRTGTELPETAPQASPERSMVFRGSFPHEALNQILKINRALITEHEPSSLFKKILQYATELSGAESALLIEIGEGGELNVREAFNTEIDQGQKEISQQVARRVLQGGDSIVTRDAQVDQGFNQFQSVVSMNLKSIACIPIRVHQKIIGLLYLTHRYKTGLFNAETVNALEAFGDQAGLALQNSHYVSQLKDKNLDLHHRLVDAEEEIDRLKIDLRSKVKNPYPKILGKSRAIVEILKLMDRISDTNLSILIVGETGSGKELVARSIHENSRRRKSPFVAVNCGAIPETLIESELFGHRAGSFTGATRDKKGLMEEAHQGTLFLDEIAELPLNTQVKLLRAVQEKEVLRIGDTRPTPVDLRVIAATHRHLENWVAEGKFREDLYYRVAQMVLPVPPLRDRREDLLIMSEAFLKDGAAELGLSKPLRLGKDLLARMMEYDWPGNVRELENFIRTAAAFAERGIIHGGTLPEFLRKKLEKSPTRKAELESEARTLSLAKPPSAPAAAAQAPLQQDWTWNRYEECLFAKALLKHQMNCEKAAESLGVGVATVYLKMRKYGLKSNAHQWAQVPLPLPEGSTLAQFKQRLVEEVYRKHDNSPYAAAKALALNVGTIYRLIRQ